MVITACGSVVKAATRGHLERKTVFRFAMGSDWHYGQPGTASAQFFHDLQSAFHTYQQENPCEFFVLNGDVIHNDPQLLLPASKLLKTLHPRIFTTRGNHDMVTAEAWQQAWGFPLNHDVVVKNQVILLGDTADEKGKYLCPDMPWFSQKLEQYKDAENIFIFLHITPVKWTDNAVDCPEFQALVKKYQHVRAVFNGHDHDQDSVKMLDSQVPFLFDGHVGGNWGTNYHGFRIVELKDDNSILTFVMNPHSKQDERTFVAIAKP